MVRAVEHECLYRKKKPWHRNARFLPALLKLLKRTEMTFNEFASKRRLKPGLISPSKNFQEIRELKAYRVKLKLGSA